MWRFQLPLPLDKSKGGCRWRIISKLFYTYTYVYNFWYSLPFHSIASLLKRYLMLNDLGWSLLEAWYVGIKVLATIIRKLELSHFLCGSKMTHLQKHPKFERFYLGQVFIPIPLKILLFDFSLISRGICTSNSKLITQSNPFLLKILTEHISNPTNKNYQ